MKSLTFIAILFCFLSLFVSGGTAKLTPPSENEGDMAPTTPTDKTNNVDVVRFSPDNVVVLRGQVGPGMADHFISQVQNMTGPRINIYIDTMGGSVFDGNRIVQKIATLHALGKEVVCIAEAIGSMGFVIFQSCPVRYSLQNSILMQHQMSLGLGGELAKVQGYLSFIDSVKSELTAMQAKKMSMDVQTFENRVSNEWWMYGNDVLKNNAADRMVHVTCDFDHTKHTFESEQSMFFGLIRFKVTLSKCPMIKTVLANSLDKLRKNKSSDDEVEVEDQKAQIAKLYDLLSQKHKGESNDVQERLSGFTFKTDSNPFNIIA